MTEQPSMAHLELTNPSPEFDILRAQRELQKRIGTGFTDRASTNRELLTALRANDEATRMEMAEVFERLPWKAWRKGHREALDELVDEDVMLEIRFELIDMLHFWLNEAISAGFEDWDDVMRHYWAKNKENWRRQDDGY